MLQNIVFSDTLMCQIGYAKTQIQGGNIISILRPKVKVIEVMNICDTSSHGERPMCQIWYDYVIGQKNCGQT